MQKRLIVNADDFGLSEGVNRGIALSHERGILTSASLMVRQSGAQDAAQYARQHPRLGVGLHIDLGEWDYREGAWKAIYQVVPLDDRVAIEAEIRRQLDEFRRLMNDNPTHVDSHQHVHGSGLVRSVAAELAAELGVPLRNVMPDVRYCGDFYGQSGKGELHPECIGVDALLGILRALPPGVTELACHPGDDAALPSSYRQERMIEVATLCDPIVKAAIVELNLGLCSFRDFRGLLK